MPRMGALILVFVGLATMLDNHDVVQTKKMNLRFFAMFSLTGDSSRHERFSESSSRRNASTTAWCRKFQEGELKL